MYSLRDLDMVGDLWRVSVDIPVVNGTKSLVIPRPNREGPANIAGGRTTSRRDGITILGKKVNINSGGSPIDGTLAEGLTPAVPEKAKVKK